MVMGAGPHAEPAVSKTSRSRFETGGALERVPRLTHRGSEVLRGGGHLSQSQCRKVSLLRFRNGIRLGCNNSACTLRGSTSGWRDHQKLIRLRKNAPMNRCIKIPALEAPTLLLIREGKLLGGFGWSGSPRSDPKYILIVGDGHLCRRVIIVDCRRNGAGKAPMMHL